MAEVSAYMNALREEGTRDDLLAEVDRQQARAERAEAERDEAQRLADAYHTAWKAEGQRAVADAAALRVALENISTELMLRSDVWAARAYEPINELLASNDAGASLLAKAEAWNRLTGGAWCDACTTGDHSSQDSGHCGNDNKFAADCRCFHPQHVGAAMLAPTREEGGNV